MYFSFSIASVFFLSSHCLKHNKLIELKKTKNTKPEAYKIIQLTICTFETHTSELPSSPSDSESPDSESASPMTMYFDCTNIIFAKLDPVLMN